MKSTKIILNELRQIMKSQKYIDRIIDAYIIPTTDPHRNEYVPERFKRREFISKFTGSNGTALITDDKALLWTDGRYYLQAEQELDKQFWILMKEGQIDVPSIPKWLNQNLKKNCSIGIDPQLISIEEWNSWKDLFEQNDQHLISIQTNFIDLIWNENQPNLPSKPLWIYPIENSGLSLKDKLALVRSKLIENQVQHLIVHRNDDIAWLFNLRGSDIPYNPVFLSFAIVSIDSVQIYIDLKKLSLSIEEYLRKENIEIFSYDLFYEKFQLFSQDEKRKEEKFYISSSCNYAVQSILSKKQIHLQDDLVYQLKSIKNSIEIQGMKNAHIKDGLAVCLYLQWIEENIDQMENLSELSAAEQLRKFRLQQKNYLEDSFEYISAFGSNGSIIHYKANEKSNKLINKNHLYLIDSGGQYLEGTTDVTRTIHLGEPNQFEKECFTRVLKGMISLSRCIFPSNTIGARLDSFARRFLWDIQLDYSHGTGHGVGCCLNVHEGPQSIGTRIRSETTLVPGMILSNEPGFYLKDQFGIRIENCLVVVLASIERQTMDLSNSLSKNDWLTFEQLTMVPIQLKLIDEKLLDNDEKIYLNNYHQQVYQLISEEMKKQNLDEKYLQWLKLNTRPI